MVATGGQHPPGFAHAAHAALPKHRIADKAGWPIALVKIKQYLNVRGLAIAVDGAKPPLDALVEYNITELNLSAKQADSAAQQAIAQYEAASPAALETLMNIFDWESHARLKVKRDVVSVYFPNADAHAFWVASVGTTSTTSAEVA